MKNGTIYLSNARADNLETANWGTKQANRYLKTLKWSRDQGKNSKIITAAFEIYKFTK